MTRATRLAVTLALWAMLALGAFGAPPTFIRETRVEVPTKSNGDALLLPKVSQSVLSIPLRYDVDEAAPDTAKLPVALVLNRPGQFGHALEYLSDNKVDPLDGAAAEPPVWVLPLTVEELNRQDTVSGAVEAVAELRAVIPGENALRVSNLENYRRALQDFAGVHHMGWFGRWRSRYGAENANTADVAVKPVLFIPRLPRTWMLLEARVLMQHTSSDKKVTLELSDPLAQRFDLVPVF